MPDTFFISVDIEATGPAPGPFSMVSIGAWVIGEQETFYAELKPISERYDEAAMRVAMPGRTHEELYESGEAPEEVMARFAEWVDDQRREHDATPVFVAHNAPFDWMFVAWYLWTYVGRNPFGWAAIDTRALFMGMTGAGWEQTRLSDIKRLYRCKRAHKHHALADAIEQGDLFDRMNQVLEGQPDPGARSKSELPKVPRVES